MLISGIYGRKNIQDLEIDLDFPDEVFAGTDFFMGVRVRNPRKRMPAFLVSIHTADGRSVFFPYIEPGATVQAPVTMRFETRGSHAVTGMYLSSTFPFNFFTRRRRLFHDESLIVFPKPVKCNLVPFRDRQSRSKGDRSSDIIGYESGDIVSIRDYVAGDPTKYISWKSTAKTGKLKTKELSSIELQHVIINFDQMDRSEYAISCVTYTVVRLTRSKIPVGLVIEGETLKPSVSATHRTKLLRKLALYGQSQGHP
ncbi:MAG: DUF58 domain-containing protein [Acidobacteriota bacterium]